MNNNEDNDEGRTGFELRELNRHHRMRDKEEGEDGGVGGGGRILDSERGGGGSYGGGDELEDDYGDDGKEHNNRSTGIFKEMMGEDDGTLRAGVEGEEEDERLSRPFLSHWRLLGISLFWLGNNIIWTALSMFLLQDQVKKVVEEDEKGSGLALIIMVGG